MLAPTVRRMLIKPSTAGGVTARVQSPGQCRVSLNGMSLTVFPSHSLFSARPVPWGCEVFFPSCCQLLSHTHFQYRAGRDGGARFREFGMPSQAHHVTEKKTKENISSPSCHLWSHPERSAMKTQWKILGCGFEITIARTTRHTTNTTSARTHSNTKKRSRHARQARYRRRIHYNTLETH